MNWYKSQGRYAEAEPMYQQALEMFERCLGKEHPYTITVRNNLVHRRCVESL